MPANLRIGVPLIPLAATSVTLSSGSASTTYPITNLFGGNRTDHFQFASALSGNVQIGFDAGSAMAADFLYVGGAKRLIAQGVSSINLRSHTANTYASGADATLSPTFGSGNLFGPHGEDYIATFTSVSRQFWWLNTNAASASVRPIEKLFFGASFDMDRDPDADGGVVITRTRKFGSQRRSLYTLNINWTGVAYAKAVEFYRTFVLTARHQPLVLFTTTYHPVLNDARVIFCRLTEASMPPKVTGICDVSATFEEMA